VTADEIRFDGQVAIVTGAGHGLGRGYARALAARGAAVVCNDVVADRVDSVASEIRDGGGVALAEPTSVATAVGGTAIVQTALDAFGSIEIVINNAGQLRNSAFEDMPVEEFQAVLDTHLAGSFYVTQPAFRHMKAAGYGRIVFTSSAAGMFGGPWSANYGAAKAGLVGLCNVVALEGARHGIHANAVMPMALTGMNEGGPPPYSPEDLEDVMESLRPLAPHLTVEHVAPLVVYLASSRCRETHRVFSVGAGHVARVFIGATRGWYAPGREPATPEQVEAALDAISDLEVFAVPESMMDESRYIAAQMPLR
jgi:NAD(P)-dependent dehydrogenase (short-subunit alcohol dehydrogenase family)